MMSLSFSAARARVVSSLRLSGTSAARQQSSASSRSLSTLCSRKITSPTNECLHASSYRVSGLEYRHQTTTSRRWKSAERILEEDHDHSNSLAIPSEEQLRYDLAVAHRLIAKHGMDMLTWNHISHRFGDHGWLITPGDKLFEEVRPQDLLVSSQNITADIIHASIYEARPDVNAIIHLHTPFATTVSCMQQGFVPYTQDAAYFYNKVVRYEWDGVSNNLDEGPLLQAAVTSTIPDCNTLLMDHHGFACFGKSVKEVFVLAYYFERACEIQCRLMTSGATPKIPNPKVMSAAAETSYLPDFAPGESEWDALCRSVNFDE